MLLARRVCCVPRVQGRAHVQQRLRLPRLRYAQHLHGMYIHSVAVVCTLQLFPTGAVCKEAAGAALLDRQASSWITNRPCQSSRLTSSTTPNSLAGTLDRSRALNPSSRLGSTVRLLCWVVATRRWGWPPAAAAVTACGRAGRPCRPGGVFPAADALLKEAAQAARSRRECSSAGGGLQVQRGAAACMQGGVRCCEGE